MTGSCSIQGCDGQAEARGMCQAHYMRWYTKGDPGKADIVRRPKGRLCSLEGCDRPHQGRGYCDTHLQRVLKHGNPGPASIEPRRPGATCSIDGCEKPLAGRGWCNAHYIRWRSTGSPTTPFIDRQREECTYNSVHLRLRKQRGAAKTHPCSECGDQAGHWAYDYSASDERRDEGGRIFSPQLDHYRPLCHLCHRQHDVAHNMELRGISA